MYVHFRFFHSPDELEKLVIQYFEDFPQYHIELLHCNPCGDWNIGGFTADFGLTGRKIQLIIMPQEFHLVVHLVVKIVLKLIEVSYITRRIAVDILEERPEVNEVMVQLQQLLSYNWL